MFTVLSASRFPVISGWMCPHIYRLQFVVATFFLRVVLVYEDNPTILRMYTRGYYMNAAVLTVIR